MAGNVATRPAQAIAGGNRTTTNELRVAIFGEFAIGNIGNDISAWETIRLLLSDFPGVEIELITRSAPAASAAFGLPAWPLKSEDGRGGKVGRLTRQVRDAAKLFPLVRRFDVIVVAGTGLLEAEVSGAASGLMTALAVLGRACQARRVPIVWFAIGGNGGWGPSARLVTTIAAPPARYRSYRDALTLRQVLDCGVQSGVDVASRDLVFRRASPALPAFEQPTVIAIGAIDLPRRAAGSMSVEATRLRYVDNLTEVCEGLLASDASLRFVLGDRADVEVTAQVTRSLKSSPTDCGRVEVVETATMAELEAAVAGTSAVLASRFHTLVAATLQGSPPVALSHADKDDELMAQFDLADLVFDAFEFDPPKVVQRVLCAVDSRDEVRRGLADVCAQSRQIVEADWAGISNLIATRKKTLR